MGKVVLENVTKKIKGSIVIDNISLSMKAGTVVGLQGINGSGKTMLMRLISGLIHPTEGQIKIDGKILHKHISFPDSIGLLLENPAFWEPYSGIDNLKLLASIKGQITEKDIQNVLELVGLDSAKNKKYKKYSLGMKQRLGIAAAVMEKSDVIILDEPTNSLDSDGVDLVKDIIRKERERGALVILACHDFSVLKDLCDVIYPIVQGKINLEKE